MTKNKLDMLLKTQAGKKMFLAAYVKTLEQEAKRKEEKEKYKKKFLSFFLRK